MFRNEIIWYYGGGGASKKQWAHKHDDILFYTKSRRWTFNVDEVRQEYKWVDGQKRADGSNRNLERGKLPDDVIVMHGIMPWAGEYRGYKTQKPESLVSQFVKASSNAGDIVLDPFAGTGTTAAVSQKLGRRWIAIDVSPIACKVMSERLNKIGAQPFRVIGAPKTVRELRKLEPFQFQNWVVDRIGGRPARKKSGDMGIDGYSFFENLPIQIKQSDDIGRNVVDNFEAAVRREHKNKGYIIAFSFGKGAYEEAARASAEDKQEIVLVRVDEIDKYFKGEPVGA